MSKKKMSTVDLQDDLLRLLVIGGGYIGLELGTVYQQLGSQVHLIEIEKELLPALDPEVGKLMTRRLKKLGMKLHLGSRAVELERGSPSRVAVEKGGKREWLECDQVMMCVGRKPNTKDLGLAEAGVDLDTCRPRGISLTTPRPSASPRQKQRPFASRTLPAFTKPISLAS